MIIGIGLEIVDIDTWELAIASKGAPWIQSVFTIDERKYCQGQEDPYAKLAGIFAAKQAVLKALAKTRTEESDFHEVEILCNDGKTTISLKGKLLELRAHMALTRCFVSITQTSNYAVAVVVPEA